MTPTRRMAAVAGLAAVVVWLLGSTPLVALLAVNGLLLAAGVVDALAAPSPQRISFERDLPEVLPLGGTGTVEWRLRAPGRWPLTIWLSDELAPSLRASPRRLQLRARPRRWVSATATLRPARRGRFVIERARLRVAGPLGLVARQGTIRLADTLRVYPPFRSRKEAELRIEKARILEVGLRSAKGRGGGTEFDQLREYGVDDEFRRIDWAATARAGKPIVRTCRAERNQTVVSLLDNGRVMAGRVTDVPRVELAMDAVMALTTVATRLGDRAGFVAFDRVVRALVPPASTRDQLGRVTEAMYELEPELSESNYRGAFVETMARFRRRTMLVVYTDLVEQAVGEFLLPALPMIARSHLVLVAAVRDPDVVRWAREEPHGAGDAYRKAAAIAGLEERRRTAARLRAFGVTVVDEPPERLAARLADSYLQVKATGRL